MSDRVKYLRAVNGGLTPWEIAEKSGVPAREIHLLEVKHRRVGENEEILEKLADFFNVPVADLINRREAYRKRLTFFLEECRDRDIPIVLKFENGEQLEGKVAWFGREAVALTVGGGEITGGAPGDSDDANLRIVQRGWVADWRRADSLDWEVAPSAVS